MEEIKINEETFKKWINYDFFDGYDLEKKNIQELNTSFNKTVNSQERIKDDETRILKKRFKETIYNRYYQIEKRKDKEKENFSSLKEFFEWWINECQKKDGPKCYYCGTTEREYKLIYDKKIPLGEYRRGGLLESKKRSFHSYKLEIDRKNPNDGYNSGNCVFACHLCNNAKSDLIHADDFKVTIAEGVRNYIKSLLQE